MMSAVFHDNKEISKVMESLALACGERAIRKPDKKNRRRTCTPLTPDILECTICREIYRKPKLLPACRHTFCEVCLETLVENHKSIKSIPCPLCRTPWDHIAEKAKDLEISIKDERLFTAWKAAKDEVPCALCALNCHEAEKLPMSEFFCVECSNRLCQDCAYEHQKQRQFSDHAIYLLKVNALEQFGELEPPALKDCIEYDDHVSGKYCEDCSKVCSSSCLKSNHHLTSIIEKATAVRLEMKNKFQKRLLRYQLLLKRLDSNEDALNAQFKCMEQEIRMQAQKLKEFADKCAQDCLEEVEKSARTLREEMNSRRSEVDFRLRLAENTSRLLDDAPDCGDLELIDSWNDQQNRDTFDGEDDWVFQLEFPIVRFDGVQLSYLDSTLSSFGSISVIKSALPTPYLQHLPEESSGCLSPIRNSGEVTGMTTLRRYLCVSYSGDRHIHVGNLDSLDSNELRRIEVPGCSDVKDIASVESTDGTIPDMICIADLKGIILMDFFHPRSYYQLKSPELERGNMSTTKSGNLLLSFASNQRVVEIDLAGGIIWRTLLDADTASRRQRGSQCMKPSLAIEMGVDRILVSDQIESRLCILGRFGELVHEYNWSKGAATSAPGKPQHMTIDKKKNVLVLETRSNPRGWQVILLSPNLEFLGVLVRSSENEPTRICLDSDTGRLYVGMKDGRVESYRVMDTSSGSNKETSSPAR